MADRNVSPDVFVSRVSALTKSFLRFRALLYKNYLLVKRDKRYFLTATLLPIFLTITLTINLITQNKLLPGPENVGIFSLSFISKQYSGTPSLDPFQIPTVGERKQLLDEIVIANVGNIDYSTIEAIKSSLSENFLYTLHFKNFTNMDAIDEYLINPNTCCVLAGLIFHQIDKVDNKFNVTIMYNATDDRTLPQLQQVLMLALDSVAFNVQVMPNVYMQQFKIAKPVNTMFVDSSVFSLTLGIVILLPIFVQPVVLEREKELKEQLLVSGASVTQYWISKFVCDGMIYFFIAITQFIFIGPIAQAPAFTQNTPIAVLLLYTFYGVDLLAFCYLFSFIFKKAVDAEKWAGGFLSISITFMFLIARFVLKYQLPTAVQFLLCIFPTYSLFYGLSVLGLATLRDEAIQLSDLLLWKGYGGTMSAVLCFIILQSALLCGTLALFEYIAILRKRPGSILNRTPITPTLEHLNGEEDVIHERQRVADGMDNDILRIVNIGKVYGKGPTAKKALDNISLGVGVGTCFGLLGPNGAGKTTMLNILSGVIGASTGCVYIDGHDIFQEPHKARMSMGVCPQSDRVWENLTVREHVAIYSMLRGHPDAAYVSEILNEFHINEYADKAVKECSGGMKRKLSVAMAFIGDPRLILLDEPSSGMDPRTRRQLWNHITRLIPNRAVILTSHSMEEIDALCERIGIVVNGRLSAVGSSQSLKGKYGSGYRLSMTIEKKKTGRGDSTIEQVVDSPTDTQHNTIHEWIMSTFPTAVLVNSANRTYHYEIRRGEGSTSLADMFDILESNKERLSISDYSISQTTLEQVFLNFARKQID